MYIVFKNFVPYLDIHANALIPLSVLIRHPKINATIIHQNKVC